jgi:hypothetical protein
VTYTDEDAPYAGPAMLARATPSITKAFNSCSPGTGPFADWVMARGRGAQSVVRS